MRKSENDNLLHTMPHLLSPIVKRVILILSSSAHFLYQKYVNVKAIRNNSNIKQIILNLTPNYFLVKLKVYVP